MVDVPAPLFTPLPDDPSARQVAMLGYDPTGHPGEPALPVRVVVVAVPPTGDVRVSALAIDVTTTDGVLLAPVPFEPPKGAPPKFSRDPRAYAVVGPRPAQRARVIGVSWLRNQRVARIELLPMDYDAAGRRVTTAGRLDVTVEVAGGAAGEAPARLDHDFDGVFDELLVNSEQGKAWRRPAPPAMTLRATARRAAGRAAATALVQGDTVFAKHRWVKIAITKTGFYKITYGQLRRLGPFADSSTVLLSNIRMFTWGGAPVMPESTFCEDCGYREVALQFVSADNSSLSQNTDYFYFRALGPSGWADEYDPARPDTVYIDNPYETHSYYYLTISTPDSPVAGTAKRIGTLTGAPAGGTVVTTFPERMHFERDDPGSYWPNPSPRLANRPDLPWEKFFWSTLQMGGSFDLDDPFIQPPTPGIPTPTPDTTQAYRMKLQLWGVETGLDYCTYSDGSFQYQHIAQVTVNGASLPILRWGASLGDMSPLTVDTTLAGLRTTNDVQVKCLAPGPSTLNGCVRFDRIGIAYLEILYRRRLIAEDSTWLAFRSEAGGGDWSFQVDGFKAGAPPRVFDVTDPLAPIEILDVGYTPDAADTSVHTLAFERAEGAAHHYLVIPADSIVQVRSENLSEPVATGLADPDLRSTALRAKVIILYFDAFKTAADTLASWRSTHLPVDGTGSFDVATVPVSAVFDQFSGGRGDPAGIRGFLRAAYFNWNGGNGGASPPTYVTILGDASFDPKNLKGVATPGFPASLIPTYENGFDFQLNRQFSGDDWMLSVVAPDSLPQFFAGRIPAPDAASAMGYIQKMLEYERSAPFGAYRNAIMLVADDDLQGQNADGSPRGDQLTWQHVQQTTQLDTLATPPHFDRRYVYEHRYPLGPGQTRPGARQAIFDNVNSGVQLFNFVGHGSAFKIADESVLVYSDPGSFKNADRPTSFVSASCDVGKFDDPDLQGLGERMVLSPNGGAIGAISATEEALSGNNATLNQDIFESMFHRDTTATGSGQYTVGMANALLAAKLSQRGTNSEKYELLGDAGIRLNLPRLWVVVSLWDSAGTAPVDSIQRGQTLTYRGEVRQSPSSTAPLVPFDGTADVLIEDAQPMETPPDCAYPYSGCLRLPYYVNAAAMFRGDVSVRAGRFEGRFVAPLEAAAGRRSRVRAYIDGHYAAGSAYPGIPTDGVGSIFTRVVPGVGPVNDNSGPRISLSFAGGSTSVRPDAVLQAVMTDPSGILTTDHTPQNGIIATIDGNSTTRIDITSSFRYAADSYQNGTATLQLPNLAAGPHTVEISAADNLAIGLAAGQHRSTASLAFQVVDVPPLSIQRTYLFPDPTRSTGGGGGGSFVIDAPGDSINVLLRIYTVSGKLIRQLTSPGGIGQVQIPWDGRDAEGDALANGVYFYKVYVYARESDGTSSPKQNDFATGKFVIVNR